MAIEKVLIKNFKKYKGIFEISFNKGTNIIVGNNEEGKSTILEAIHLALTGVYAGRSVRKQISSYLFNNEIVEEYLKSVNLGKPIAPPEILVELYFYKGTCVEYEGNGNQKRLDKTEGISVKIAVPDKYMQEYGEFCKATPITSLPIEYYEVVWSRFDRNNTIPKNIGLKSVLIDSSNYRYQNGSDVYISRAVKEFMEPEDVTSITQAYRKLVDEFGKDVAISSLNEKISKASTIVDGKISISADQGVQNSWENNLVTKVDDIPFAHIGKGTQCIVKTQLALEHKKAESAGVILLEEPECHLSFSHLNALLKSLEEKRGEKQYIITTHSSYVSNKLGLENLILLTNAKCLRFDCLEKATYSFFRKISGYDTLRFILCKKAILVEGDSDDLVIQRAYMDVHGGKLPIQNGTDVMAVGGITFKRYLDIAKMLNKETYVVTDNDGDIASVENKYQEYRDIDCIHICYDSEVDEGTLKIGDKPYNYNTLEPKLLKANSLSLLNDIFDKNYKEEDELRKYMKHNKTECALAIFDSSKNIKYPEYIKKAVINE